MIIETDLDIVNFDAYSFLEYFVLYPKEICEFIKNGGAIAWGIVPTHDYSADISLDELYQKLNSGLDSLQSWGLEKEVIAKQSIITPACGMGTMDIGSADKVLELLSGISKMYSD